MQTYSIRQVHLTNQGLMAQELGVEASKKLEEFVRLYARHATVLKVISREKKIDTQLLATFSLRSIPCWLQNESSFFLFSNEPQLRDWSRTQSYVCSEEEHLLNALRGFLRRTQRFEFEMVSEHYMFQFGGPTRVMGILNVTPDSFYDQGKLADPQRAIDEGIKMEADGADIIDVGGESTRPGAAQVSEAEELERVIPVIEGLAADVRIPLSVDTYKAQVAEAAIQAGATIVNDISGMQFDAGMPEVINHYKVPVVLMHIKGKPHDMQINPTYDNLLDEIYMYFEYRIDAAIQAGIERELIIIDPGIGFGKRLWDNYELLQRLPEFRGLGCPILIGPSRKSFIGKALDLPVEERLEGTAAAVTAAVLGGSHIIRVHDIKEMLRVVQIADLIAANVRIRNQDEK